MAYQKGLTGSSAWLLVGGSINIPSWSSGSKCQRLPGISSSLVKLLCSLGLYFEKILVKTCQSFRNFVELHFLVLGMH